MRPITDPPGTLALGMLALAALLHFAHPAPISAQDASARAVATVVSVSGIHEARTMLARLRMDLAREGAREARPTRQEDGGIVVEARREAARGGVTVTVAHLGN
jgi:hypothetical protein